MIQIGHCTLLQGDCRAVLRQLPRQHFHCVVTSPPYFGLRSYLPEGHEQKEREIGQEPTPAEFVKALRQVFKQLWRVLRDDGVVFLNLGDSYSQAGKNGGHSGNKNAHSAAGGISRQKRRYVAKPKDLLLIPWRVALALQADGWYVRQWHPWVKRNPISESVRDRAGTACEVVLQLAKSPWYAFDMEAVKRPAVSGANGSSFTKGKTAEARSALAPIGQGERSDDSQFRNFRNSDLFFDSITAPHGGIYDDEQELLALDVTSKGTKLQHFATFPVWLAEVLIRAGTMERGCCAACGTPWRRQLSKERVATRTGEATKLQDVPYSWHTGDGSHTPKAATTHNPKITGHRDAQRHVTTTHTMGWEPGCTCTDVGEPVPCRVLDPFAGVATTGVAAICLGRAFTGIELSETYLEMAAERLRHAEAKEATALFAATDPQEADLFTGVET